MATTESSKDDRDDLEERVDELEEIVTEQRQTIKKMLPDRRQFLKGAGVGGVAALSGLGALNELSQGGDAAKGDSGIGTSKSNAWEAGYFDYAWADVLEATDAQVDSATVNIDGGDDVVDEIIRLSANNAGDVIERTEVTNGVSTSSTIIHVIDPSDSDYGSTIILVGGVIQGGGSVFYDLIFTGRATGVSVVQSKSAGGAASRTYSVNKGSGRQLELSMGSDTYNVRTRDLKSGEVSG